MSGVLPADTELESLRMELWAALALDAAGVAGEVAHTNVNTFDADVARGALAVVLSDAAGAGQRVVTGPVSGAQAAHGSHGYRIEASSSIRLQMTAREEASLSSVPCRAFCVRTP